MVQRLRNWFISACFAATAGAARAVVFASTGDVTFNTTAPTGPYTDSGWQYQGEWMGFTGTPIAPQYFITAKHVAGSVGTSFVYLGVTYTTDAFFDSPDADLRIWHVTSPFPNYAPLYASADELSRELVVAGRGKQRGSALDGHGWLWGSTDGVLRWGTNVVSSATQRLLSATFDAGFSVNEATLAEGDSGGGWFIRDSDGIWKLAAISLAVSGPYKASLDTEDKFAFNAALHDQEGYYELQPDGGYLAVTGAGQLFGTRLSSQTTFIRQVTGIPEPSTAILLGGAAVGLGFVRARRLRSR
jgi:hypothetical protein